MYIQKISTKITMEYQKIINLLGKISNEPSKFWTENCVEINDHMIKEIKEKYLKTVHYLLTQ